MPEDGSVSEEPLTEAVFLKTVQKNNETLFDKVEGFVNRAIDAALDKRELAHQETIKGILVIQERQNNLLNQDHERTKTLFNRTDELKTNQDQQRGSFKTVAIICTLLTAVAAIFAIMSSIRTPVQADHHHDIPKIASNKINFETHSE